MILTDHLERSRAVIGVALAAMLLMPTSLFLQRQYAYGEPDAETGAEVVDDPSFIGYDKDGNPIFKEDEAEEDVTQPEEVVTPSDPQPEENITKPEPKPDTKPSTPTDERLEQQLPNNTDGVLAAPLATTPSYQVVGGTPPVEDAIVQQYNSWQADVEQAQRDYQEKLDIYNEANRKMEEGEAHLREIEDEFSKDQEFLAQHIRNEYLSQNDGMSPALRFFEIITTSKSLNDFLNTLEYYERINEVINNKIDNVRALKEEQEQIVAELEEQSNIAKSAMEEAAEFKTQVDEINQELEDLIQNRISTYSTPDIPAEGYSDVIQAAYSRIGLPYVWGGKGEDNRSFDCSGLTQWCYKQVYGIDIGVNTSAQYANGKHIPLNQLKPGDVLFRDNRGNSAYQHVAIYIGGDKYIHAPSTGRLISIGSGLSSWTCGLRFVEDMNIPGVDDELQKSMEELRSKKN